MSKENKPYVMRSITVEIQLESNYIITGGYITKVELDDKLSQNEVAIENFKKDFEDGRIVTLVDGEEIRGITINGKRVINQMTTTLWTEPSYYPRNGGEIMVSLAKAISARVVR